MRRRLYISVAVVVVVLAALTIGLAVARAQEATDLPALTPTELLASMAEKAPQTEAVSGEFSWANNLFGAAIFQSFHGGGSESGGPGLDLLMQGGSGRLWLQGSSARLESQGLGGDTAAIFDGGSLWIYDSQADTATEYTLPAMPEGVGGAGVGFKHGASEPTGGADAVGVDLPGKIQEFIEELAPTATLAVTQGGTVAGRDSYLLTMTPTAANTVVGSAQVAVDGETFLPLRVQVFAKGDADPVLSAGFTSISYEPIDASVFEFTPPADATVVQKTLTLPADMADMADKAAAHPRDAQEREPLTLAEAQAEAGFTLAVPDDPTLAFQGAYVIPAHQAPVGAATEGGGPGVEAPTDAGVSAEAMGPVAVLAYGQGFGTVLLVQTQAGAADMAQLTTALAQVPVLGQPVQMGDKMAYELGTKLGSAMLWQQDGLAVLAAGMVSSADLASFVGSVD